MLLHLSARDPLKNNTQSKNLLTLKIVFQLRIIIQSKFLLFIKICIQISEIHLDQRKRQVSQPVDLGTLVTIFMSKVSKHARYTQSFENTLQIDKIMLVYLLTDSKVSKVQKYCSKRKFACFRLVCICNECAKVF